LLGPWFWVLGSGFWVLGSGFWVLGSGYSVLRLLSATEVLCEGGGLLSAAVAFFDLRSFSEEGSEGGPFFPSYCLAPSIYFAKFDMQYKDFISD
jgi:hypothetical protein